MGVSFFAKDRDFCLIYANPNFYQRLGLKSQKELLGKNDFELFPEPLAKKFRKDDEWIVREVQAHDRPGRTISKPSGDSCLVPD